LSDPLITAAIAAAGIVVGWFVIGTQRVTEELTKERRSAYARVLAQADEIAADRGNQLAFERAVRKAEFLCSDRMYEGRCLPGLVIAVDKKDWAAVERFRVLARFESHRNSILRRWCRKGWYTDPSTITGAQERDRRDPDGPSRSRTD